MNETVKNVVNEVKKGMKKFLVNELSYFEEMKMNRIDTLRFKKKMEHKGDKEEEFRYFPVIFMCEYDTLREENVAFFRPYALAIYRLEKGIMKSGNHFTKINMADIYIDPETEEDVRNFTKTYADYIMSGIAENRFAVPKGTIEYPFRNNVVYALDIDDLMYDHRPIKEYTERSEIDDLFNCSANYIAMLRNNLKRYIGYQTERLL